MNIANNYEEILTQSLGIIDGLFLLLLAVSGNFIAETFGCQTQELLSESIMAKQIMTFFIIFFTISYSNSDTENPTTKLIKSSIVYIFFLLFTKMNIFPTVVVLFLLMGLYISNNYKKFFISTFNNKKKSNKNLVSHQDKIKNITKIQKILIIGVVIVISMGFFNYYKEKQIEYKNSFEFRKFIFGVVKCKKME
jgi:hypothetical protein